MTANLNPIFSAAPPLLSFCFLSVPCSIFFLGYSRPLSFSLCFPSLLSADNNVFFIKIYIFSKTHVLFLYFQPINRNNKILNFPSVSWKKISFFCFCPRSPSQVLVSIFSFHSCDPLHEVNPPLLVFNLQLSAWYFLSN